MPECHEFWQKYNTGLGEMDLVAREKAKLMWNSTIIDLFRIVSRGDRVNFAMKYLI